MADLNRYQVVITTADRGTFKVAINAASANEAESVACAAVRYQFSHSIITSHAQPI
jgi:hypothetical protein